MPLRLTYVFATIISPSTKSPDTDETGDEPCEGSYRRQPTSGGEFQNYGGNKACAGAQEILH